jgi:hypothetical protein
VLRPHEEAQHIAVFPAAEAVEALRLWVNHKRRVAVFMEGASGDEIILATTPQGDVTSDNILDSDQGLQPLYLVVYWANNARGL